MSGFRTRSLLACVAAGALLLACANDADDSVNLPDPAETQDADADANDGTADDADEDPATDPDDASEGEPTTAGEAAREDDELTSREAEAVDDFATSVGENPGDIEVATAEEVMWPDGSLGCPEPDQMYTQAIVEGYRIVLEYQGEEAAYHGQWGQAPFRCEDPQDGAAE